VIIEKILGILVDVSMLFPVMKKLYIMYKNQISSGNISWHFPPLNRFYSFNWFPEPIIPSFLFLLSSLYLKPLDLYSPPLHEIIAKRLKKLEYIRGFYEDFLVKIIRSPLY